MSEQDRLPGLVKSAWAAIVASCLVGVCAVVGLLADLAQVDGWISTGGPPVVRVFCYAGLIVVGAVLWKRKFFRDSRTALCVVVGIVCLGGIASAPLLWPTAASDALPGPAPSEPEPILSKAAYRLTPSSNPLTNDRDKIDLDTGCPGWGPSATRVGRNRCGDLADLIAEDYGLHSPDDTPRLAPLAQGEHASYTVCRRKFDNHGGVGVLRLADLPDGVELCVMTDKDNIAAVRVDSVTSERELIVTYRLWQG